MRRVLVFVMIFSLSGFAKGWIPPEAQEVQNAVQEANILEQKLHDGNLEKECRQRIQHRCKGFGSMNWMCKKQRDFFGHHGGFQSYKQSVQAYVDCIHRAVRRHDMPGGVLECKRHRPELDCTKWMKKKRHKRHDD